MKIYNSSGCAAFFFIPLTILFLIGVPYFVISQWPDYGVGVLIIFGPFWLLCVSSFRHYFGWFVIDEKGITSKLPFKNVFIAWDEMEYIGVGARRGQNNDYIFIMYFSKVPVDEKYIYKGKIFEKRKEQFFVRYKYGLLEEVLKYVDEEKIKNIDWIRNCPDPGEWQEGFDELMGLYDKRL